MSVVLSILQDCGLAIFTLGVVYFVNAASSPTKDLTFDQIDEQIKQK